MRLVTVLALHELSIEVHAEDVVDAARDDPGDGVADVEGHDLPGEQGADGEDPNDAEYAGAQEGDDHGLHGLTHAPQNTADTVISKDKGQANADHDHVGFCLLKGLSRAVQPAQHHGAGTAAKGDELQAEAGQQGVGQRDRRTFRQPADAG